MKTIIIFDYQNKILNNILEKINFENKLQIFYFQGNINIINYNFLFEKDFIIILYLNNIEKLKKICKNITKKNSLMLINEKNIKIPCIYNEYIHKTIYKFEDLFSLCKLLESKYKYIKLNKIVSQFLNKLGYNFSLIGTQYLAESLNYIIQNQKLKKVKLNKDIYLYLAKKYNISVNNIKCNINFATEKMRQNSKGIINSDSLTTKSVIKLFILNYKKII